MLIYFDCVAGVSGDMCLGALLDLGARSPEPERRLDAEWLFQALKALPLPPFRLEVSREARHGVQGLRVRVEADEQGVSRDQAEIRRIVGESALPPWVRDKALAVFDRLARAEAKAHGCSPEHVHFHEAGGTDALVDICGTLLCLDRLCLREAVCSPVPLGTGFTRSAHGVLPVPAPATVGLLEGCPVLGTGIRHELATPTGAALVSTLSREFGPMPAMKLWGSGCGLGARDLLERPNCLRVFAGKPWDTLLEDHVAVLTANIDDMCPEMYGHVSERLFAAGALDVLLLPAQMKKGRPGARLEVVSPLAAQETLARVLLTETTTLGVRHSVCRRTLLAREPARILTPWGEMGAKRITAPDGNKRIVPEYEECRKVALEHGVPLLDVYRAVVRAAGDTE
jgi:uncharacterized protein (TIGR00299 family) protein